MKIWDKIKRGMDAGFDAAITAVYNITEKTPDFLRPSAIKSPINRISLFFDALAMRTLNIISLHKT